MFLDMPLEKRLRVVFTAPISLIALAGAAAAMVGLVLQQALT